MLGLFVFAFVGVGLWRTVLRGSYRQLRLYEVSEVEMGWTIVPGIILFSLAIPSIRLLYAIDEGLRVRFRVKIVGHQ